MSTTASKQTIQEFLFNSGIDIAVAMVSTPAALYELPERDWVYGEFASVFDDFKDKMKMEYEEGDSACDYFADAAKFLAKHLHATNPKRTPGASFSFPAFYFQPTGSTDPGHAINAPITRNDAGLLEFAFFEPQTSGETVLMKDQISLCSAILF